MTDEPQKSETAKKEEEVLKFWDDNNVFQKSLEKKSTKGEFVFYEGPPTANGKPGIHHMESRSFKDAIPRYKTMRGYRVKRKAGWDTHGLPVELEVEKQLGFSGKKDIEDYGIAEFNKKCKESVGTYIGEWDRFTKRIGYWVDGDKAYYTYKPDYMESVWNIIKKVSEDKRLYKDFKVVPWCSRCETALSSHELAQGYEDVSDLSVTVKMELVDEPGTFFLAWTTTPWTLPGNVALAVGKDIEYGQYKKGNEQVILAKALSEQLGEGWNLEKEFKGSELVGKKYKTLYPYLSDLSGNEEKEKFEKAYQVYEADFVTVEDGTGIVHTAVLYGQDDFELGTKIGLPKFHLVNSNGHFIDGMDFLSDRFVRDEEVAVDIIKDLAGKGLLFSKEKYKHSYPFCWRCKTPLIYYARDSWFINMEGVRNELISENRKINWEPENIKEGRMGDWLKNVRDWALTRERYWATPLPVWESDDGKERLVVGSVEELKKHTQKSGNKYLLMRHGQALTNERGILSVDKENKYPLTKKGEEDARNTANELLKENIDLVFVSPVLRAQQTSKIVKDVLGLSDEQVITENRIRETEFGDYEERSVFEYNELFPEVGDALDIAPNGGETKNQVRKRVGEFLYDIENKYKNKNILIISHGNPSWLMGVVSRGLERGDTESFKKVPYPLPAEYVELPFVPLPHNDDYELDLHRPYIDEVSLVSENGKELKRGVGVLDVWFDSGAMPFAQDHYPFENKEWIEGKGYPADFISEAIDQTRGWFYTLLAVGVLMGRGAPYKNVISLGHLLDEKGQKMSKSKGNIINPWEAMDQWGADTIRFWMYSVNSPGDSKIFDEKTVREVSRTLSWLENSTKFYELYKDLQKVNTKEQPIDIWMKSRVDETVDKMTQMLDVYDITQATRTLSKLFEDMSQWYVRRIRDRAKDGDSAALETLEYTLKTSAKLLAPFAPFMAEQVYKALRKEEDPISVHLCDWPSNKISIFTRLFKKSNEGLLGDMELTRETISEALKARQVSGIKVRQPLSSVTVKSEKLKGKEEFLELIKDEVNVKDVLFNSEQEDDVVLDTKLTPELEEEGEVREIIRFIQDLRKKAEMLPKDKAILSASDTKLIEKYWDQISKTTNMVEYKKSEDGEMLPGTNIKIHVRKSGS